MPRRRTFAPAIVAFAHSMLTALRHPCLRLSATPALGTWAAPHGCIGCHTSPRREPGDSGFECRPTCHAGPGKAQGPGVPGLPSGASYQQALGPEGRVSTSGRRPAKKKSQDAMFFVNTSGRVSTSGRRPAKRRSAGCRAVACIQPMGSPSRMHPYHYGVASRSPSAWRRMARSSAASLRERFFSCIAIRGFFLSSCSWRARKSQ